LILASASPRRAELLTAAGFEFEVVPTGIDETPDPQESAEAYVLRVASEKAHAAREKFFDADSVILAADTEVVVDGEILGKPATAEHAREMLHLLSGRTHDVLTAVVVHATGRERAEVVRTRVEFATMTAAEIESYVATGEPMGKAGAYAIQGYAARFIVRIDGSWSNVVGLPVHTVHRLIGAF
jgi:septum formation protein